MGDSRTSARPARLPAELVFRPLEAFAAVEEPGADPLVRATAGGSVIPAGGLVLVYGDGGAGKTTLVIDLCFALARGVSWLGILEPVRPLRIAIVENEGPRPMLREKLGRKRAHIGSDPSEEPWAERITVLEEPWARFTFADDGQRRALALELVKHQTDLLVAGPLSRVGMEGGGTLDDIGCFEELLLQVRELVEQPFAILLVHHQNRAGQVSGAWEGVPDTLVHVTGQGHGRTRVLWQKVRWSSELHGTSAHLTWADGESYTVEDRPEISEETMVEEVLAAVRENPGASWSTIRKAVHGKGEDAAKVRDRLLEEALIVNAPTRAGGFNLWAADDPAAPRSDTGTDRERPLLDDHETTRSEAGTVRERVTLTPPVGAAGSNRSPVPAYRGNGERNGTAEPEAEPTRALEDALSDPHFVRTLLDDGMHVSEEAA